MTKLPKIGPGLRAIAIETGGVEVAPTLIPVVTHEGASATLAVRRRVIASVLSPEPLPEPQKPEAWLKRAWRFEEGCSIDGAPVPAVFEECSYPNGVRSLQVTAYTPEGVFFGLVK